MNRNTKAAPRFIVAIITLATCVAANQLSAAEVFIGPGPGFPTGANVNALAGPLFASDLDDSDLSMPGTMVSAMLSGNTATHAYGVETDFSMAPAFFDSIIDLSRTATIDHRASAESVFHFTVDDPAMYDAMGFLSVDDDMATTIPGNVELEVELLEFSAPDFSPMSFSDTKLYSYQVSKSTIDESFVVGGSAGDTTTTLVGSTSGLLDPSMFYKYRTLVTINAIDIDGSGGPLAPTDGLATAMSEHALLITAAIPEPASGLALLVFSGVVAIRRRR